MIKAECLHFFRIRASSSSNVSAWSLSSRRSSTSAFLSLLNHHLVGELVENDLALGDLLGPALGCCVSRRNRRRVSIEVRVGGDCEISKHGSSVIRPGLVDLGKVASVYWRITRGGLVNSAVGIVDRARLWRKGGERRIAVRPLMWSGIHAAGGF